MKVDTCNCGLECCIVCMPTPAWEKADGSKKFTDELYVVDHIRTYSGQYVNVFDPDPATILIEDIAHALSNQCRYSGHLKHFYSVGQHSLYCSKLAPQHLKLAMLLHDASEAYLVDMPSPVKRKLPDYKKVEAKLMHVIATKFGFLKEWENMHDAMKRIDRAALETEWLLLMLRRPGAVEHAHYLKPIKHEIVKFFFLQTFNTYYKI
jgi:5'-deoxynucleotidase YfbR-like HD superfamily hydrolase